MTTVDMVTYLINLDGSDERLNKAHQELVRANINYQRISAVDGRGLDIHNYEHYDSEQAWHEMGRDLIGAEIGCYLSHKKCLNEFLATDAEYALVLEDDLQLTDDIASIIEQSIAELNAQQSNWYLMNIAAQKRKFTKPIKQFNKHTLYHAYYFPMLGLGLLWTRKGAQAFLASAYGQKIFVPVDVAFQSWLCQNGKGLSIYPPLVVASGVASDIDGQKNKELTTKTPSSRTSGRYIPRQKRMWRNRLFALQHLYFGGK